MFTRRKLALLMFKSDGDNHYQIEQALRSYCVLVLSGHRYLKRFTKQKSDEDQRIDVLPLFLTLRKKLQVRRVISEESLEILKQVFNLST